MDVDFATACLESLLRRHGDLIARPPRPAKVAVTLSEEDFGLVVAKDAGGYDNKDANRPFALVEALLAAKQAAHGDLFSQITRSIALIDFMRNATSTLQM